jgi:excisionase family DNA binding protein
MPFGPPKPIDSERGVLLKPGEVAQLFRVDITTVRRWADSGRLGVTKTPGGQRRYHSKEVYALLNEGAVDRNEEDN